MLLIYKSFEEVPGELRTQVSVHDNEWVVDVMPSSQHAASIANIQNQNAWYRARLNQMAETLDEIRKGLIFAVIHREHYIVRLHEYNRDVDFVQWCKDNCKGPFHAFIIEAARDEPMTIFGVFTSERDATLFKLFLTE
jgi:hypothetical protein